MSPIPSEAQQIRHEIMAILLAIQIYTYFRAQQNRHALKVILLVPLTDAFRGIADTP